MVIKANGLEGAGGYLTVPANNYTSPDQDVLRTVYRDGQLLINDNINDIRTRLRKGAEYEGAIASV